MTGRILVLGENRDYLAVEFDIKNLQKGVSKRRGFELGAVEESELVGLLRAEGEPIPMAELEPWGSSVPINYESRNFPDALEGLMREAAKYAASKPNANADVLLQGMRVECRGSFKAAAQAALYVERTS